MKVVRHQDPCKPLVVRSILKLMNNPDETASVQEIPENRSTVVNDRRYEIFSTGNRKPAFP
jgi:hypothetical protein